MEVRPSNAAKIVTESGGNPDEPALHSLHLGAASALAAGGTVLERVIQREGRWKSGAYNVYARNNRRTSVKCRGKWQTRERSLRYDPARIWSGENCNSIGRTSDLKEYEWSKTIWVTRSPETVQ